MKTLIEVLRKHGIEDLEDEIRRAAIDEFMKLNTTKIGHGVTVTDEVIDQSRISSEEVHLMSIKILVRDMIEANVFKKSVERKGNGEFYFSSSILVVNRHVWENKKQDR